MFRVLPAVEELLVPVESQVPRERLAREVLEANRVQRVAR